MISRHISINHPVAARLAFTFAVSVLSAVLLLLLSGCVYTGAALRATEGLKQETITQLQEINDRFLEDAELMLCQGASKGALDRRYGVSSDLAESYNRFCRNVGGVVEIHER